ncbi:MAG: SBBP repeat-containing protein [Bacteroidetes bacterium]|nr:SBBP repeat-containing protein [Bacteroidota bacterium]
MKIRHLFILTSFLLCLASSAQHLEWAYGIGAENNEKVTGMAVDSYGDIIISGWYNYSTDLDPSDDSLIFSTEEIIAGFIAKYNTAGDLIWAVSLPEAYGVVCDNEDNIYVMGDFNIPFDFDPSADSVIINPYLPPYSDLYLARYSPDGQLDWVFKFGSPHFADWINDIAIDKNNNIYITGYSSDSIFFHPAIQTPYMLPGGPQDIILAKYDTAGSFQWGFGIGGDGFNDGKAIAIDPDNNVYLTGCVNKSGDFDPGPGESLYDAYDGNRAFIAKYSGAGQHVWSFRFIGGNSYGYGIACDKFGNVLLTGLFHSFFYLDSPNEEQMVVTNTPYWSDIFLVKYNSTGNYLWGFSIMEPDNSDVGRRVACDSAGNVYFSGEFHDTADFDPGPGEAIFASGDGDVFIAKYNPFGYYIGLINLRVSKIGDFCIIDNHIFAAGYFGWPACDVGPGDETYIIDNIGQNDIFIAGFSDITSIYYYSRKDSLYCYPNPVSDILTIHTNSNEDIKEINITGISGSMLSVKCNIKNSNSVNLSQLPAGAYIITVQMNNVIYRKKIIKL